MAKPSKRVAARQAELSKRKKQHRPLGDGAGSAVAEPLADELAAETPKSADTTMPTAPAATTTGSRAAPTRAPQAAFRQPSFQGASRTGTARAASRTVPAAATRPESPAIGAAKRPMPRSPYRVRDLKAMGIVSTILLVGLIALRVVL